MAQCQYPQLLSMPPWFQVLGMSACWLFVSISFLLTFSMTYSCVGWVILCMQKFGNFLTLWSLLFPQPKILPCSIQQKGCVDIITNNQGHCIMPSWVSFSNDEHLIGDVAKNAFHSNPQNAVFDAKCGYTLYTSICMAHLMINCGLGVFLGLIGCNRWCRHQAWSQALALQSDQQGRKTIHPG